jgi:hypothetical protein
VAPGLTHGERGAARCTSAGESDGEADDQPGGWEQPDQPALLDAELGDCIERLEEHERGEAGEQPRCSPERPVSDQAGEAAEHGVRAS